MSVHQSQNLSSLSTICEAAAWSHLPVYVYALVVVSGQEKGSKQSLLNSSSHVRNLFIDDVLEQLIGSLRPEDFMNDVATQHDATLELLDGSDIPWPDLKFVLWNHGTSPRIVKVFVHLNHFQREHDPPEQGVVELNGLAVTHLLDVFEGSCDGDFSVIHWMIGLQERWIIFEHMR